MSQPNVSRFTLKNGLRVVAIDLPGRSSMFNLLAIRSGSLYETDTNNGVAHFLEHMVFKGTEAYAGHEQVAQAIEGVGGSMNAWTSYNHTAYMNTIPSSEWKVGLHVPFELAFKPLLRQEDLERERGVILEEIRMYRDDPAIDVWDVANEVLFAGNPLARSVLGTEQIIQTIPLKAFTDYRQNYYRTSQSVYVIIGDLSNKNIQNELESLSLASELGQSEKPEAFTTASKRALKVVNKKTDQTHFVLSTADPQLGLHSAKDRITAIVLNNLLGEGMSSRLFLNVRERQGLAYSINSHFSPLEDCGSIAIYGGVNTDKTEQALQSVRHELDRLQTELVNDEELGRVKRHVIGSFDIGADYPTNLARWYGVDWLFDRWETHEEVRSAIQAVTSQDIKALAERIFDPERLTLAAIGPYPTDDIFARFLLKQ